MTERKKKKTLPRGKRGERNQMNKLTSNQLHRIFNAFEKYCKTKREEDGLKEEEIQAVKLIYRMLGSDLVDAVMREEKTKNETI